jgi:hypothetical protein
VAIQIIPRFHIHSSLWYYLEQRFKIVIMPLQATVRALIANPARNRKAILSLVRC